MTLSVSLLLSYPFLLLYLPNCFESDPHFSYCSFRSLLSCYFVLFLPLPHPPQWSFLIFLESIIILGYVVTAEDLELGMTNERKLVMSALLELGYLNQYDIFYFHLFAWKCHDFTFYYICILFHNIYRYFLLSVFPSMTFILFSFPTYCE